MKDIFERNQLNSDPALHLRSEFEESSAFEMPTGTPSDLFTNSVSIETMEEEDTLTTCYSNRVPMYQYLYLGICLGRKRILSGD